MKNLIITLAMAFAASVASAQWVDDLYGPTQKTKKSSVVRSKGSTVRSTNTTSSYSSQTVQNQPSSSVNSTYNSDSESVSEKELITSYDEALQRRIVAMRNSNYEQPESYWQLMDQYQAMLEKKYDQNLYNIVLVGDQMWVEPQWLTSLFDGSDPAAGVIRYNKEIRENFSTSQVIVPAESKVTININIDPWDWSGPYWNRPYYGWNDWYSPFWGSSWYWGSHHHRWGWYDPFWGGSYYPYYRPYYRPSNPRGTYYGNSYRNNGNRFWAGNSYSSSTRPTNSNRPNYRPNNGSGSGLGGGRPNGNNTVIMGGARPRPGEGLGGVSSTRPTNNRPNATYPSYERPASSRPNVERPNTSRPNVERPNTSRPTYERPTTTRPTYERPATTTRTERPASTYERPSSPSRSSAGSVSRGGSSSGGSSSGGASRPTGGGRSR